MTRKPLHDIVGSHALPARGGGARPSWDVSKDEEAEPAAFVRREAPAMSIVPSRRVSEPQNGQTFEDAGRVRRP
ncbi:MAG TPA: hypothetical protein VGL72_02790 [Bryobacteraceae bacterium]|jgi:hypothetical protein